MTKWLREFRIIPVLLIAAGSLLALKSIGLLLDGGYTLGQRLSGGTVVVTTIPGSPTTQLRSPSVPLDMPATASSGARSSGPKSWMQEVFNYPEVTGSVAASKPKEPPKDAAVDGKDGKKDGAPALPAEAKPGAGTVIAVDQAGGRPASAAERALLERLQERRQELDARARELDLRESLVKSAEKKLEAETASQKEAEAKDGGAPQRKEAAELARMKAVVTMYETMKPKEAAKIFDRLDSKVLFDVASQIKPQLMAAILAQMSADAAERLTVELTARGGSDKTLNPSTLPKIDGKPDGG